MKMFSKKMMIGTIVGLMMMGQSVMGQTMAPYVDGCLGDVPNMVQLSHEMGIRTFNLGFIVADASGNPSWGGKYPLLSSPVEQQIKDLRANGGDVIVSVGGAVGTPLHVAIKDEKQLTKALEQIVKSYDLDTIDFDLEGQGLSDLESARRLMRSVKALQKVYPHLEVWLTLPVAKDGLTTDGKAIVDYAVKKGVSLRGVNLMAMNYGNEGTNPSDMGDNAIRAAEAVVGQLDVIYKKYNQPLTTSQLWDKIGLTPMIGVNDTGQVFSLEDAQQVAQFAMQKDIGYVGYWSLARDKQGSIGSVSPVYSGVIQEPFAYTKIFARQADPIVGKEIKVLPIGENDITETTTYFEWEQVAEVKSYRILRDAAVIKKTEELEYTDSQLKSGVTYYYVIEGLDQDGKVIAKSKVFSVTTKGQTSGTITPPPTYVPSGTWQPGVTYKVGDTVTYDGKIYQCAQQHQALGDWQPNRTPALWTILPGGKVDANGTVWDVQVQYKVADVVTYEGKTYSCIQAHKSLPGWEPSKTPALWGLFNK